VGRSAIYRLEWSIFGHCAPSITVSFSMSKNSQSTFDLYPQAAPPRQPMPNRLVRLLSEARWLAMAVALLYFVLILISYNKADPGWSHENAVPHVANLGGRAGAWLADLLLFIFGFSAWWLCVCFARRLARLPAPAQAAS
jgi:S-DNA-T family DNA segregation ATPase FtsK/SpoIIIE